MKHTALALSACAAAMIVSTPALANDVPPEVQAELEELRSRVQTLEAMVEQLVGSQTAVASQAAEASAAAVAAQAVASEASEAVAAAPSISMGAAPRVRTESGWDFRPFGRIQYDMGYVSGRDRLMDPGLGWSNELRRGRIGVRGAIPGGFEYKVEVDFAGNDVTLTDALISYDAGDFKITVGQHNPFQSLEELTSSRFTSFIERAAFTDAFGFERRVGLSVNYANGDFRWDGGVFTSNIDDLTSDEQDSYSFDTRAVYSPEVGGAQLHFGGSLHWRDLQSQPGNRYRQRPLVHSTDTRMIATPTLPVTEETSYGLEAAVIRGPFHAVAEVHWLEAELFGMTDPTFFGGYAEAGLFLTPGDTRGYSGGKFNRTRPARTVDEGGIGAVQINVRYDYLDLNDAGVVGGQQNLIGASVIWTPIDHARLSLSYGHIEYDDAAIPAGADRNYSVDSFGVRAEVDF
ncbi:OprO/OprP family phosphate-selective porin [Parasphingopyxis lamellibrachiae]|uniref:Phosphate-selective porin OprO/OprP n=1 Tax=Parasphingopyxis lamellibrachiae TaxID=680125 RepID=A0A3D9FHM7_9SPHN|nr:porin [Parasphingopyxis lamellibrachiae]RED16601.1 phosphate-selective porin OprO/OprP [Parasphingopyxis lamellibrachiae]